MTAEQHGQPVIDVGFEFHLADAVADDLHLLASRLADELVTLDSATDNAFDAAVGIRADERSLTIDLVVSAGGDALACAQQAMNVIRAAARAAGFGTHALVPASVNACAVAAPEITCSW